MADKNVSDTSITDTTTHADVEVIDLTRGHSGVAAAQSVAQRGIYIEISDSD